MPDYIVDVTAAGNVTGTTLATTGLICSGTNVLSTDSGGNFVCVAQSGGAAHNFLSATHTDSVAASPTRGDIVVANTTPAWARFAVGASNSLLTANGTDPSWSASPTVTSLTATGTVTGAVLNVSGQAALTNARYPLNGVLYGDLGGVLTGTAQGGANTVLTASAGTPTWSATPTVTSITATDTVTGVNVAASGSLQLPISATAQTQTSGTMVIDNTDDQVVYRGGQDFDRVLSPQRRFCGFFENLTSSDTNILLFTVERNVVWRSASCKVSGFTTLPTLSMSTDSGNSINGVPTCTGSGLTSTWTALGGTTTTTGTGVSLRFSITNTPAPVSGTGCLLCVDYTDIHQ